MFYFILLYFLFENKSAIFNLIKKNIRFFLSRIIYEIVIIL